MSFTTFHTLGRSGLIVRPLALGTMTFGAPRWGSSDEVSEAIFNAYVDAGGNFIDTADVYSGGRSEELLGGYIADRSLRDKVVLATKFTFNAEPGNPNASGNGRKNMHRALENSLRRLRTDYVDLYWMHIWDMTTPVEEVLESFGDLQRAGKIRYFGLSNVPAWYAAKAATLADLRGLRGLVALQLEYSLVARDIEREHLPAAREFGLAMTPWGSLSSGFLTGKYQREGDGLSGQGRFEMRKHFRKFTDGNWRALDALRTIAAQVERPMGQVALAWALAQRGITSLLLGASKVEQFHDNLASLEIRLTPEQLQTLDESSALDPALPFTAALSRMIFGGVTVET